VIVGAIFLASVCRGPQRDRTDLPVALAGPIGRGRPALTVALGVARRDPRARPRVVVAPGQRCWRWRSRGMAERSPSGHERCFPIVLDSRAVSRRALSGCHARHPPVIDETLARELGALDDLS
jgi:hypothetical protein